MTQQQNQRHQYLLELTPDQTRRAEHILGGAGIPFDPARAAAIADFEDDSYFNLHGSQAGLITARINERLDSQGLRPLLSEPDTLEQTLELLKLAASEFTWRSRRIDDDSWRDSHQTWQDTAAGYPTLFLLQPDPAANGDSDGDAQHWTDRPFLTLALSVSGLLANREPVPSLNDGQELADHNLATRYVQSLDAAQAEALHQELDAICKTGCFFDRNSETAYRHILKKAREARP